MSYSNEFLRDFKPVFSAILKAKGIRPDKMELEVIDEEPEDHSIFEPADAKDVLEQLSADLNFLTIFTDRPAYFGEFAETMYEENGLVVMIFPKECFGNKGHLKNAGRVSVQKSQKLVLDFEWEGACYLRQTGPGRFYIPIHKKPWETAENLDIMVPIGYNTVIVKGSEIRNEEPVWDRFETAFYEGK